jgi:hypothetical protein
MGITKKLVEVLHIKLKQKSLKDLMGLYMVNKVFILMNQYKWILNMPDNFWQKAAY